MDTHVRILRNFAPGIWRFGYSRFAVSNPRHPHWFLLIRTAAKANGSTVEKTSFGLRR